LHPKWAARKLADGSMLAADGQLAGTPSVLFDAVAVILSDKGAKDLSMENAVNRFRARCFSVISKAIAATRVVRRF